MFYTVFLLACLLLFVFKLFVQPRRSPLAALAGPPVRSLFTNQLSPVLDPAISPKVHEIYVARYGRSIRIRGVGPWDDRLLTLDPLSVAHVLKHSNIYEKPWPSRRLITSFIGCGMISAEGAVHKRQRRVATPAFSIQNMRALVPLVFLKGNRLKDRWSNLVAGKGTTVDVYHWISRATFDVIGLAGFDYNFDAIQDESNELFTAYKEMFEVAVSQGSPLRTMLLIYLPLLNRLFPDHISRTVSRCQAVIKRVAGNLVQEKKRKVAEGEKSGQPYEGRDLLTLLLKSNVSTDISPQSRISDDDILHNVNTFMFVGSDTSSLSLTWTLLLLARNPQIQTRLRQELLSVAPNSPVDLSALTEDEVQSLYEKIADHPYLYNVIRESLRLIPPLHSSLRVATRDDVIPTKYPVHARSGRADPSKYSVHVPKGSFVHVAVEGFNLDKEIWGEDAWEFNPDRWDNLPETAQEQPGLFSNILTFSGGPRSCIGMRFAMIEMKSFLYLFVTNFVFSETDEKVIKANVVFTRPYVSGKFKEGSQCPLILTPYVP